MMKKRIYALLLALSLVVCSVSFVSWADESLPDADVSLSWDENLYVPPAPSDNDIMTMAFDDSFTSLPVHSISGCNIPYAGYGNSVMGVNNSGTLEYCANPIPMNAYPYSYYRYVVAITGNIDGLYETEEKVDSAGNKYTYVTLTTFDSSYMRFVLAGSVISSTSRTFSCDYVAVNGDTTYFVLRPFLFSSVSSNQLSSIRIYYPRGSEYTFNIGYFYDGAATTDSIGTGGGGDGGGSGSGDSGGSGTAT